MYLECMRERDVKVKSILLAFELGSYQPNGEYLIGSNDKDKVATFMECFTADSAFSVSCAVCDDIFRRSIGARSARPSLLQRKVALQTIKNKEQMDRADHIEIALETNNPTQQIASKPTDGNNVEVSSESFEIFVQNFPSDTECDAITALIVHKTALIADKFVVSKMVSPKKSYKYLKFMSFKIKTSDKATYDAILSDEIWAPFTKAVPFNVNARTESKLRKQQNQKQKLTNQNQPKVQLTAKNQPQNHRQQVTERQNVQQVKEPVVKPVNTHKRQHNVNQPHDNSRTQTHSHKAARSHARKDHKSARPANGLSNRTNYRSRMADNYGSDNRGSHHDARGSNFPHRPVRGSNFHGKKWNNHKPLNDDLKSILSLLRKVLDQY